jgi:hypothetical protein
MIMTMKQNTQEISLLMELSRPELCFRDSSRLKDGQAIPPDHLSVYEYVLTADEFFMLC